MSRSGRQPTETDDDELRARVEEARVGRPEALEALLRAHMSGLLAYVRVRLGARLSAKESASDIVQSVCADACLGLRDFRYEGAAGLRAWLYTLAEHKIVERARYYGRAKRDAAREVAPLGLDEAELLEHYRDVLTPSREASAREELERVEEALARLPESYREVIVLSRLVGLSHEEIAERMGRTRQAVWTLHSRALARLSSLLQGG